MNVRRLFRVEIGLMLLTAASCAQLPSRPELPVEYAPVPGANTTLDRATAGVEAGHPQQSAFRLLIEGTEAFVTRMQTAQAAGRSIDVQTYIWHADFTGTYLAQQVLEAADRGVKVRLLLDDMDARAKNAGFAALAAHPNMQVRVFNPFASRSGTMGFFIEGMTSFGRINHRMHNKSWIVDNRIAVVGGRNIGDEYFGASEEVNFIDLDFAMIGPVVRDASASFDKYWNSSAVYPMDVLDAKSVNPDALEKLRRRLTERTNTAEKDRYAEALREDDAVKALISGERPMQWTSHYQFVSDDPLKALMKEKDVRRTHVGIMLAPLSQQTQHATHIISPYFVPGEMLTKSFIESVATGKQVQILTNSLVANDVAAVHGGYSRYRKALVEGGVQLWELKPLSGEKKAAPSLFGSSGASLHTKALSVDGKQLFVGSYNLDPRSTWLNCEQGVLVTNEVLAGQFMEIFARQTAGQHAWRVTLQDHKLSWSDGSETFDSDPKASWGRRFTAWFTRALHLDAQL